jgi:hypothetical protein
MTTRHRQHRQYPLLTGAHRHRQRREPQVALRHLARLVADPVRRVPPANNGRSSRTRSLSTVNDLVQPIRSAITVAGIVGHSASNERIRPSTASTAEPRGAR